MLLEKRVAFKPFEYPELEDMWIKIQKTYWIHNSIEFSADVQHFKTELNDKERYIIGTILKSFTQTEVFVFEDFWSKIGTYLPKPEVQILGAVFSENECRHSLAYARLNDVLGLQDFDAFLKDPILVERFNNLSKIEPYDGEHFLLKDIVKTLIIFGCFTEYVNLFSQFAILKSFSANGRNLLPNIGTVVDYSALDEDVHARSAIYLANKLKEEYPKVWGSDLKKSILEAAKTTFEIELKLINQIFEHGDLINLKKSELINFMKNRIDHDKQEYENRQNA